MESLHYLLMKANTMFSRQILSEVSKIGLTPGQPKILDFLLKQREADQKTIAAYCEIEQATVGSILLRMESAGLVVRRQKEGNRRSLYVSLTEKGQNAAERLMIIFQNAENQAVSRLTKDEAEALKKFLTKMCDTMQPPSESQKGCL